VAINGRDQLHCQNDQHKQEVTQLSKAQVVRLALMVKISAARIFICGKCGSNAMIQTQAVSKPIKSGFSPRKFDKQWKKST